MLVASTARALREHSAATGRDYWLQSGRGIRDAQIQPHHGVNLTIALMVQPIEGPALVDAVRSLEYSGETERSSTPTSNHLAGTITFTEQHTRVAPGTDTTAPSLGYLLDAIAFALAGRRRYGDEVLYDLIRLRTPMVRLRLTPTLSAEVHWPKDEGEGGVIEFFTPPQSSLPGLTSSAVQMGLFSRVIEISADQFRHMAAIVGADTNQPVLISEEANAASKSKTAASGPARDQSAAARSDQPARTELDGSPHLHPTGERETSQSSFRSRAEHDRQQGHQQDGPDDQKAIPSQKRHIPPRDRSYRHDFFDRRNAAA